MIRKGKNYPYGIHVKDMKELCADKPIEKMPAPPKVYISMLQHIGAPAIPIVKVGDKVNKRQLIGEASGVISANVFSSVCGTVTAIEDIVTSSGLKMKHVVIENDGRTDEVFFDNVKDFEPQTIIERIRLAGIVGLGGAGFPTAVKLSPKTQLDTLVINGAECEPYLNCDYRLMIENTDDIYRGIKYAARALNIKRIVIGIEANKPDAIKAFEKYTDLEVVVLKKQYPMGSEKHLIYCTTGRKVPCGKMPFDVGCCVQNIKTVIAIKHAIEDNKALSSTVLTVSGGGIKTPKNLRIQIGTPLEDVIEYCGGVLDETVKIVAGGPMMGKVMIGTKSYTRKTNSGYLFLTEKETSVSAPTNCINCAECAKNCPMRLMPMYIEAFAQSGDYEKAEKYGAMNCIECGSCAYNCPAKRSLVQSISMAKTKIKEMKKNGK
ncbi:MAG: electron transport complex subunit RsxC [Clostridia bacterium]|nr:electron transport complex subunit RsxC [Clostridia bacterium]